MLMRGPWRHSGLTGTEIAPLCTERRNDFPHDRTMDCRQFRKQHGLFVDDTLSGVATQLMRDHLVACASCAQLDARLRRALMLARSAPRLEPSPGFQRRLAARLAAERFARFAPEPAPRWSRWRAAAAVAVLGAGLGVTSVAVSPAEHDVPLVLAPVVVTPPMLPAEPVAASSMFATVSSSLPVYPAVLLAQRATEQFAAAHARTVSFQAAH